MEEGKIITGYDFRDILEECSGGDIDFWTVNETIFCDNLGGGNQCIYGMGSDNVNTWDSVWDTLLGSINCWVPPMPVSAMTANVPEGKLIAMEDLSYNPLNIFKYLELYNTPTFFMTGCTTRNAFTIQNMKLIAQSSSAFQYVNASLSVGSSMPASSFLVQSYGMMSSGQANICMLTGSQITYSSGITAVFKDNTGGTIATFTQTSPQTGTAISLMGPSTNVEYVSKLSNLGAIFLTGYIAGTEPVIEQKYQFNLPMCDGKLYNTNISITSIWDDEGATLIPNSGNDGLAVCIYDQDFRTKIWTDNYNACTYSNGILTLPWEVHNAISGKTSPELFVRVPLYFNSGYKCILYFQLSPTSMANGQKWNVLADNAVFLDMSSTMSSGMNMPDKMTWYGSGGNSNLNATFYLYQPSPYSMGAITSTYRTVQQGDSSLSRDAVPNPHYMYFRNATSGNKSVYTFDSGVQRAITTITSSSTAKGACLIPASGYNINTLTNAIATYRTFSYRYY